jgi:PAS domain S-box-containing protein
LNNQQAKSQSEWKALAEKYKDLFDNSPVGIYRSNSKGELLIANQALAEIMGCRDVKELKNTYQNLARELYYDSQKREEFLKIIIENDKIEKFIFRALTKNGRVIFLKLSGHISKKAHDFFEIDGFIEEITEKYQMEKRLAQSEEKFRSAFINHSSPMLIIEPQRLAIVEVNQSALDYYGYSYQKFLEMKVTDLNILTESEVLKEIKKARASKKVVFNFKHLLKNGKVKDVEVHSGPITIENEKYLFSIIHDITERKKIEAQVEKKRIELEAAEKMVNDILDLSAEAIRYVDLNYEIIKSNKRYRELNKVYQADKKNKFSNLDQIDGSFNCFDLFCTDNCGTDNCSLKLIIEGNDFIQEDVEVYLKGEKHYFIVTIVPYLDLEGKLKGIIQSYRDITERKESENKLKDYYNEIKKLYAEMDREFEKGIRLHEQFLPKKLPETDSLDIKAYFQPANRLGGDFYNVIDTGDELLIYLADVSGHGLDGSMLNIFLRELVNNYLSVLKNISSGINTVDLLNFIIKKYHAEGISIEYMTCLLIGVYNKKENSFAFSNAGLHIPPLYVNQAGELKKIENGGVPISTAIDLESYLEEGLIEYQEVKVELKPEEVLLLTTDGIIEEKNNNQKIKKQYGLESLAQVFKGNYKLPAAELIRVINQDFRKYAGTGETQDDITFLVLKRKK